MLGVAVVAEQQVGAGVGEGSRVEAQQGAAVLQRLQVALAGHAEDVQVVGVVGAHHHLHRRRRQT